MADNLIQNVSSKLSSGIPQSVAVLAYQLECDPQEIEFAIEELQLAGNPIVEIAAGYVIATTRQQITDYRTGVLNPQAERLGKRMVALTRAIKVFKLK